MIAPRFPREVRYANAHRDRDWSAEDRGKQLRDVRAWVEAFAPVEPCPACSWPFGSFHLCPAVVA